MTTTLLDLAETPVSDIAHDAPIKVSVDTAILGVVQRFKKHRCGAVLVEQDGVLVGIFTERDMMSRVDITAPGWETIPVGEVMTKSPATIRDDQTLEDGLNLMLVKVCRHLPTRAADGNVDGVLTILDLLLHITESFPEDFVNLPPGPEHEAHSRWGG